MPSSRTAVAGVFLVTCVASLDINIVATALPSVVADLGGLEHIAWVVTAFTLAGTVAMPLYGKLGDLFGRRSMLLITLSIFLISSALCGLAQSMPQLILFRGLQGLGAGGLLTLASAVLADIVEPTRRPRVQATLVTAVAISQFSGPVVGGLLTEHLSWRWVFLVNIPIGAAAMALIWLGVPSKSAAKDVSIDYLGAITLTATASLFMFALSGLSNPEDGHSLALIVSAAVAGITFFLVERRAREPILPFSVFGAPTYVIGVAALTFATFAASGVISFAPLFLQAALGLTPSQSGAAVIAQVLGMLCTSAFVTRSARASERLKLVVLSGVTCEAIALAGIAASALLGGGLSIFLVFLFLRGVGMGANIPILMTVVQNTANSANLGVATSTMMFVRSLGGVLGVTIAGLVIDFAAGSADLAHDPKGYGAAIGVSFAINAAVTCVAIFFVAALPASVSAPPPGRHRPPDPNPPVET